MAAERSAPKTITSSASPLGVLGLFIGLSEATAGAAAIGTDGASQLILAVFAVVFPLIVFAIFIWLLLVYPANLYPPDQYTAVTTVVDYVAALRREGLASRAVVEQAIVEAVSAATEHNTGAAQPEIASSIARAVESAVDRGSVTVDRSLLLPGAEPVRFPVSEDMAVQDLLDSIYFALRPSVKPFSYGESWWLTQEDGTGFPAVGASWASKAFNRNRDERTLASVGIEPGATLKASPLLPRTDGAP
jgi:hypothetical protein